MRPGRRLAVARAVVRPEGELCSRAPERVPRRLMIRHRTLEQDRRLLEVASRGRDKAPAPDRGGEHPDPVEARRRLLPRV